MMWPFKRKSRESLYSPLIDIEANRHERLAQAFPPDSPIHRYHILAAANLRTYLPPT